MDDENISLYQAMITLKIVQFYTDKTEECSDDVKFKRNVAVAQKNKSSIN